MGILARSACGESMKITTATNELHRRWKNCSTWLEKSAVEEITMEYMDELTESGYSQGWREEALGSALKGYERILKDEKQGKTLNYGCQKGQSLSR